MKISYLLFFLCISIFIFSACSIPCYDRLPLKRQRYAPLISTGAILAFLFLAQPLGEK